MDQFKGQPRLPKFAVPKRYDLRLNPDLVACTFTGTVAIDLDVVADTRFIVLNAADLAFNDASVSFTPHASSQVLFQRSKNSLFRFFFCCCCNNDVDSDSDNVIKSYCLDGFGYILSILAIESCSSSLVACYVSFHK